MLSVKQAKGKSKLSVGLNSKQDRNDGHESDSSEEGTPQTGTGQGATEVHVPSLGLD